MLEAKQIAREFICRHEGCFLVAYPDPRSPLARALRDRGISTEMVGRGHGIPADLGHLSGAPWTVGYGQTGEGIGHGTVWSKRQAEEALARELELIAQRVVRMWPGADELRPSALAGLISLVYNRGPSLRDPKVSPGSRREMRELGPAILAKDYHRMAALVLSMRRLWVGDPQSRGLLKRRKEEADLILREG